MRNNAWTPLGCPGGGIEIGMLQLGQHFFFPVRFFFFFFIFLILNLITVDFLANIFETKLPSKAERSILLADGW